MPGGNHSAGESFYFLFSHVPARFAFLPLGISPRRHRSIAGFQVFGLLSFNFFSPDLGGAGFFFQFFFFFAVIV